jgi:hypothetical protein
MEQATTPERDALSECESGLDVYVGRFIAFVWKGSFWVQIALFLGIFIGLLSSDARARCGQSSRQMLWRFGTTAELIRWEAPELRAGPQPVVFDIAGSMSESSHNEPWGGCTRCRSRDDSHRSVPLLPQNTERTSSDIGLANEGTGNWLTLGFYALSLVPEEFVVSIDLEGFERPPRV